MFCQSLLKFHWLSNNSQCSVIQDWLIIKFSLNLKHGTWTDLTSYECKKIILIRCIYRTTSKSRWNYQFSSDHWSQATLSTVSTWMGDRLGTPCDVISQFFYFLSIIKNIHFVLKKRNKCNWYKNIFFIPIQETPTIINKPIFSEFYDCQLMAKVLSITIKVSVAIK